MYRKQVRIIGGPLDGAVIQIEMETEPPDNGPLSFNGMRFFVSGDVAKYLDGGPTHPNEFFMEGGE